MKWINSCWDWQLTAWWQPNFKLKALTSMNLQIWHRFCDKHNYSSMVNISCILSAFHFGATDCMCAGVVQLILCMIYLILYILYPSWKEFYFKWVQNQWYLWGNTTSQKELAKQARLDWWLFTPEWNNLKLFWHALSTIGAISWFRRTAEDLILTKQRNLGGYHKSWHYDLLTIMCGFQYVKFNDRHVKLLKTVVISYLELLMAKFWNLLRNVKCVSKLLYWNCAVIYLVSFIIEFDTMRSA